MAQRDFLVYIQVNMIHLK
eukprot:gene18452-24159_t